MSELDDKLSNLIGDSGYGSDMVHFLHDEFIEKIKAVFTEAGYVHTDAREKADHLVFDMQKVLDESQARLNELKQTKAYIYTDKAQTVAENLMTGAGWYERYRYLCMSSGYYSDDLPMMKLARRAAGLEEDTK